MRPFSDRLGWIPVALCQMAFIFTTGMGSGRSVIRNGTKIHSRLLSQALNRRHACFISNTSRQCVMSIALGSSSPKTMQWPLSTTSKHSGYTVGLIKFPMPVFVIPGTEFLSRERRYSWLGEHWLWCLSRTLVRNGHNGKG